MSLWRKILLVYMLAHQLPTTLNRKSVDPSTTLTRTPIPKPTLTPTPTPTPAPTPTTPPTPTSTPILMPTSTPTPTPILIPTRTPTPTPKPKLRCFTCFSEHSWEDCEKESKVVNCPHGFDEACLEMTVNRWEMKNGTKTGKVLTHYMKYCTQGKHCSDTQCKEMGWTCAIECCTEDLCNTSVAVLADITLILTAVLSLAALDIY